MRQTHRNKWEQDPENQNIWSIWTEPKFAIGQRAILLQTPSGNVLWDLITLLDDNIVDFVNLIQHPLNKYFPIYAPDKSSKIQSKGGLQAIIISHPHYYTTHTDWSKLFNCPVYISANDKEWLCRKDPTSDLIKYIDGPAPMYETILPAVTAIKTGGHFPGSLVLHWENSLFIADTIMTVPESV
ncbi:MAG: hypothetical protein Q9186_007114 [Xanthomendoza sp. 1 TL-2023]